MNIAFFGSSLLSAYWNGAATYYRGLIRALHHRGHRITFYEPDVFGRREHRDLEPPGWARVCVYENSESAVMRQIEAARKADVIVKASGVGVFDALLEEAVLDLRRANNLVVYWDVDAPATFDRVHSNPESPLHRLIPRFDLVFTHGGGPPLASAYRALGARHCVPIHNALDPATHYPTAADARFGCDLAFLGNRLPEREPRVEEFFFEAARSSPASRFLLGGNGWEDYALPGNVRSLGHVSTQQHNSLNCSSLAVLNLNGQTGGDSPTPRLFEAAGAAACIISDEWEGIDEFFEPDYEILVARNGEEVAELLQMLGPSRAREIGAGAFRRALSEHTYAQRAAQVDAALEGGSASAAVSHRGKRDRWPGQSLACV